MQPACKAWAAGEDNFEHVHNLFDYEGGLRGLGGLGPWPGGSLGGLETAHATHGPCDWSISLCARVDLHTPLYVNVQTGVCVC